MSDYRLVTRDEAVAYLVANNNFPAASLATMDDPRKLLNDAMARQIVAERNAHFGIKPECLTAKYDAKCRELARLYRAAQNGDPVTIDAGLFTPQSILRIAEALRIFDVEDAAAALLVSEIEKGQ